MGSIWGESLKISLFGESHGKGIGVVVDNFPAGIRYDEEFVTAQLRRRAGGHNFTSTARKEGDIPEVISGIYKGYTTGAPICAIIRNEDIRSEDYRSLMDIPRPSHADFTGKVRYNGYNDPRGGGHFSARLTAMLTYAGALCQIYLMERGITIGSHIASIGEVSDMEFDPVLVSAKQLNGLREMGFNVIDKGAQKAMLELIAKAKSKGDSVGGVIECAVVGMPTGIGNPIFGSVESKLSSILFAIPAVKGVEFGAGFDISKQYGSSVNDRLVKMDFQVKTGTNYSGGIVGGITNSMPIILRAAFKPTPSISAEQQTLNLATGQQDTLVIKGRHDPCVVTRAGVIVESATAIAIVDLFLEGKSYGRS